MAFYWTAKGNFYAKLWTSPAQTVNGTTDSRGSVTTVCLSAGLIAEDGQKTIYVARKYYEIVNIPGEGWLRESGAECPF